MSAGILITHEEGDSRGRYVARVEGVEESAELTYSKAGESHLIIDHTGVPDAMRGMNIGGQLVRRAVEDARQANRIILPLCPFAKAYIGRHPELQDVLAAGRPASAG